MPKVTIQFRRTNSRTSYWSEDLRLSDGDTEVVDERNAQRLIKAFPGNFQIIGRIPESHPPAPSKQDKPVAKPIAKPIAKGLVSILIPQRGRPKQIKKCLDLILKNTSYPSYETILICDKDDMSSVSAIPKSKRIKTVIDPSPKRQMYVGKINHGFRITNGEYLVYLANDVEVGKDWLTEAMETMRKAFPDGMGLISFNHGDRQKHAYHGLISRKFVDTYLKGNIFYPEYIHFWCDLELVSIARNLRRFCFCDEAIVHHSSMKDTIHHEAWKKSYKQGADLLIRRRKKGFPL